MIWRFENPWLLLSLLLLPVLTWVHYFYKSTGTITFSSIGQLEKVQFKKNILSRHLLVILRILSILFLILAAARPQSGIKSSEVINEGLDIVLALDTSGSMKALDFEVNGERKDRLTVVKDVVADFIEARESDRMGMVVFGEEAFTQSPLTYDHGVLLDFLDNVEIGMAGDATAIGSAIGIAVKRLKDLKAKSKIIILLTDGQSNAGKLTPEAAAEIAKKYKIKIYTIGAGTKGKAPFLVDSVFGQRYVYQEVNIDEDTLRMIAKTTGGQYFRATDTKSLKNVYAQIDKLEKTEFKIKGYVEYNELFFWFLVPGFCLLLLEIVLGNTKLRRIP